LNPEYFLLKLELIPLFYQATAFLPIRKNNNKLSTQTIHVMH
jgi:hypothetical protein